MPYMGIPISARGAPGGVAALDEQGLVPAGNLPPQALISKATFHLQLDSLEAQTRTVSFAPGELGPEDVVVIDINAQEGPDTPLAGIAVTDLAVGPGLRGQADGVTKASTTTGTGSPWPPNATSRYAYVVTRDTTVTNSNADAIAADDYFAFTLTPLPGKTVNLERLSFKYGRGTSSNDFRFFVTTSIDGHDTANILASTTLNQAFPTPFQLGLTDERFQNLTSPVEIRIYIRTTSTYTDNNRRACIDDIELTGSIAGAGPRALALYNFEDGSHTNASSSNNFTMSAYSVAAPPAVASGEIDGLVGWFSDSANPLHARGYIWSSAGVRMYSVAAVSDAPAGSETAIVTGGPAMNEAWNLELSYIPYDEGDMRYLTLVYVIRKAET